MADVARLILVTALLLVSTATYAYGPMVLVTFALVQLELISRPVGITLAISWMNLASILFGAAALCSVVRCRRRNESCGAEPKTLYKEQSLRRFSGELEVVAEHIYPLIFAMFCAAFLLFLEVAVLHSIAEAGWITWTMSKLLVWGSVDIAWTGVIVSSIWLILYPQTHPSAARQENAEAEK